jgi:hypothetical protein
MVSALFLDQVWPLFALGYLLTLILVVIGFRLGFFIAIYSEILYLYKNLRWFTLAPKPFIRASFRLADIQLRCVPNLLAFIIYTHQGRCNILLRTFALLVVVIPVGCFLNPLGNLLGVGFLALGIFLNKSLGFYMAYRFIRSFFWVFLISRALLILYSVLFGSRDLTLFIGGPDSVLLSSPEHCIENFKNIFKHEREQK